MTPSPKEVCTITLEKENIEIICECFMKGFCCSETSNIKDIFTMWSTKGENIAYKRPSEITCLWNTITQLSKIEQNCENLHLKDNHFARNMLVEQSHQNTCRGCARESVRGIFFLGKKCFPVLAATHPEFCVYMIHPFFRHKECLKK